MTALPPKWLESEPWWSEAVLDVVGSDAPSALAVSCFAVSRETVMPDRALGSSRSRHTHTRVSWSRTEQSLIQPPLIQQSGAS